MSRRLQRQVRTTTAMRRAIQQSPESIRSLARRHGINPKTVARWRQRGSVEDLKTGPKQAQSSVLTIDAEAVIVAFRQHLLLPLDDCLGALQPFIPHLTRSSLHRCLQRHGISRQPSALDEWSSQTGNASQAPGEFRLQVTQVRLAQRKLQVFVAVERHSRFAFVQWYERATGADFLRTLIKSAPCKVHTVVVQDEPAFQSRDFGDACAEHAIELRAGMRPLWNDEQLAHIERTLERALDASMQQHRADLFWWQKLAMAVNACNGKCRLKVLDRLTPQEYARGRDDGPVAHRSRRSMQSWDGASSSRVGRMRAGLPSIGSTGVDSATKTGKARIRDPDSTREAILEAARSCLAHDGPEGLSLAEVARLAGVNRGTAYQHFKTRENLIAATAEWVSDKLFHAVFGNPQKDSEGRIAKVDVADLTDRLSTFAMDNPELSRAWLLQVLSSPTPTKDRFWRAYLGSTARFVTTDLAQENIDAEVLSVIMLAGVFLWPVWARAHAEKKEDMRPLARRFAQECLRVSMYGNLRSEHYPEIAARLGSVRRDR
jgi:AcrR family transcriptional regulator/transposase-like protein